METTPAARGMTRRDMLALAALGLASGAPGRAFAAAPHGQLTWGAPISLATTWFEPAETPAIITPFMVLYALHDAMVKPMPANPLAPCLAESFTASEDGLSYDFALRQGAKFHNDEPVTAEDVKFSFERYRGASYQMMKNRVATVEALDPHHVRFKFKQPWPDFLTFYGSATGAGWIVPKKYVEKVGEEGYKKAPIGAGPYKFVSFNPGVELVLEAFEGYWRKIPSVKRLVLKSIPDEATRLAALKRGEIDIAYNIRGELAEEIQRTPGLTLKPVYAPLPAWLYFPEQWDPNSPWHDERVRRAVGLAIDSKTINEALSLGYSRITNSIVPDSFEFYWQPPAAVYDAAKAKQLLAEAGYPNGFDAGEYSCDGSFANLGEAVLNNLHAVGIRAKVQAARARGFPRRLYKQEAQEHRPGPERLLRQRGDPDRSLRRQGRHLCLRQLSRHRRAVSTAGDRPGPQAAHGDAAQDPAADQRAGDLRADLAVRHPGGSRASGRRIGTRPDRGFFIQRALR